MVQGLLRLVVVAPLQNEGVDDGSVLLMEPSERKVKDTDIMDRGLKSSTLSRGVEGRCCYYIVLLSVQIPTARQRSRPQLNNASLGPNCPGSPDVYTLKTRATWTEQRLPNT